jgi:hypothetical protein
VVRSRSVVVQNTGRRAVTVALRYQPVVRQPGVVYSVSRRSLTVPARSTRRVRVLMTITPTALRHRIDPTMSATQRELPRQFVPDGSGRLVVRPRGKAPLRVAVYGAAKPASETTATVVPAAGGEGQVVLTGRGVDQGTGSRRYASLFSVLELGEHSGALPVCVNGATRGCTYNRTTRSADLRYVGAGSTDELLWFGVATRAQWASVGTAVIPFVDYDVDGDDKYDFQTYAFTVPDQGGSPTDVLCAVTVDYANGAVVDVQPVNFNFGDVDTNVFDTDVLMLPVSMGALGLGDEGSHPIWYRAATDVDGFPVDHTGYIEYDAGAPDLVTDGGPLFRDEDGAAVGYSLAHGSSADALVLHLHGLPGRRAEVLDLTP